MLPLDWFPRDVRPTRLCHSEAGAVRRPAERPAEGLRERPARGTTLVPELLIASSPALRRHASGLTPAARTTRPSVPPSSYRASRLGPSPRAPLTISVAHFMQSAEGTSGRGRGEHPSQQGVRLLPSCAVPDLVARQCRARRVHAHRAQFIDRRRSRPQHQHAYQPSQAHEL